MLDLFSDTFSNSTVCLSSLEAVKSEIARSSSMSFFTTSFFIFRLYIFARPTSRVNATSSFASRLSQTENRVVLLIPTPEAMSVLEVRV